MGLSSNCCHSNIGSVSAEQHSVGAKVSGTEPTPSSPPAQSLSRPPWHEAVVREQGSDTPPGRRGVTASRRRARRRRNSKDSEAQRRAHPSSRPAGRPRRRHSGLRHRRHERACSNQQHSRATTTRSRPNTAQSGPRTIWCALSRRGASEGRIGVVVARVGNQHRCRLGLKGGASVGWWCGSGREPCVGSRPGLKQGSGRRHDVSGRFRRCVVAVSYSPTTHRLQYHRRCRA